jgi:DNA-binding beta-propeller fold protein YncE
MWGSFADILQAPANGGTFNQPWGVAVGPDGSVYVTDTWNHRVQKFTSSGRFLTMWGYFGGGDTPDALYGPRGITVDSRGRVYVVDTGNKRVVVFDPEGNPITQFGSLGSGDGEFNEPVGIAIDANGIVYITDTWNLRIQAFQPTPDGLAFTPILQWDIDGWFGQGLENKPLIAVDGQGRLFVTDPDASRILQFDTAGQFVRTWGEYGYDATQFGLASGIAIDSQGRVWVTDGGNHRIMRFVLPDTIAIEPSPSESDVPSEVPSEVPSDIPVEVSPTPTQ